MQHHLFSFSNENTRLLNARKLIKMTRQKFAQWSKFRSRSNNVKTNAKSTSALFFTPKTCTQHKFYTVFKAFLEFMFSQILTRFRPPKIALGT